MRVERMPENFAAVPLEPSRERDRPSGERFRMKPTRRATRPKTMKRRGTPATAVFPNAVRASGDP